MSCLEDYQVVFSVKTAFTGLILQGIISFCKDFLKLLSDSFLVWTTS